MAGFRRDSHIYYVLLVSVEKIPCHWSKIVYIIVYQSLQGDIS